MFLELSDISKAFASRSGEGEVIAVDQVNIGINQGEFVTLLGPSGCGKTTTLRMIAGFEFPTQGRIILDGEEITNQPPNHREMAMVFQSYAIFPHLSVFENIAYGLKIKRLSKADIQAQVSRVLTLTDLRGLENRAPNQLSGGQQQRVALARALVMEPKVLLLDEPLSNLDAKLREQMRTELRRIQQTLGITSIYVTHDQVEALALSDRIVVMNQGRIEQVSIPQILYRQPNTAFVANFIGSTNFVEGVVQAVHDETLMVQVWDKPLPIPQPTRLRTVGETVPLVIRPEIVQLTAESGTYQGVVRRASYLGNQIEYEVEVHGQLLAVIEHDPRRMTIYPDGSQVGVDFLTDYIYILPGQA
jgi:iron(III) transport system ATP-binding protein